MRPVQPEEIMPIEEYERGRDRIRAQMLAVKEARRVPLGPEMTLLFENRDTVRYQIQEMLRVERIVQPDEVRREVQTYNELVPGPGELSATLLLEYPSPQERAAKLAALRGLEQGCLELHVGGVGPLRAAFDARQVDAERISAVHYLKWRLPPAARDAFRRVGMAGNVRIACTHPAYVATAVLMPPVVDALWSDLMQA